MNFRRHLLSLTRVKFLFAAYMTASNYFVAAHEIFQQAKVASKEAVRISKEAIANATEEQRERFSAMEEVSKSSMII